MILGQIKPAAGVLTNLYTPPTAFSARLSFISVCNQDVAATTFRALIRSLSLPDQVEQYAYYDVAIRANATCFICTEGGEDGMPIESGEVVRCSSASGTVSFVAIGKEKDTRIR